MSNQLDGHTFNRAFDVSAAYLLALSATGFNGAEAISYRARFSNRAFSLVEEGIIEGDFKEGRRLC